MQIDLTHSHGESWGEKKTMTISSPHCSPLPTNANSGHPQQASAGAAWPLALALLTHCFWLPRQREDWQPPQGQHHLSEGLARSQTATVLSPGSCFSLFKGPVPWKATLWAICSQLLLRGLGLPSGLGRCGAVGPHQTGWSEGKALSQVVRCWGLMPQSHLCSHPDGRQIRKEGALGVCPTALRQSYRHPFHTHLWPSLGPKLPGLVTSIKIGPLAPPLRALGQTLISLRMFLL